MYRENLGQGEGAKTVSEEPRLGEQIRICQEEVLRSKQWVENEDDFGFPEERREHLKKLPWKKGRAEILDVLETVANCE